VAREIVHDNNVVWPQLGHEHLGDISLEPIAVDRAIEHHRRDHTAHAQPGHQRGRLAVTMGEAHPQALAPGAAALAAGHIGGGPSLVDENEPIGFYIQLDTRKNPSP
jgi:hypothetical protein